MKKILALVLALMLCMSAAVAEGSLLNMDSMFPVVNEPVELEFCIRYDSTFCGEWEELWWWHYMEENTGVTIVPRLIDKSVWNEQVMIMLSSGDLPDVFFAQGWTTAQMYEYGLQDGIFIPLTEYVNDAELMPNLTAAFEMYPEAKAGSTLPDGNIYGLPFMMSDYYVTASGIRTKWITAWLDDIGMKANEDITTLDEFYNALVAIRDGDHNGNGIADEIPWSTYWGTDGLNGMSGVVAYILNAYGIATRDGLLGVNHNDGEAGFTPMMDQYYDALVYLQKLYSEGLLDADMFSQTNVEVEAKFVSDLAAFGNEGAPYMSTELNEAWAGSDFSEEYIVNQMPLVREKGDTPITGVGEKHGYNVFMVTKACEHPEVAMRWADACYDLKTSMYYRLGPVYGSEDDDWGIGFDYDAENHQYKGNYESAAAAHGKEDISNAWYWIHYNIASCDSVGYFGLDECLGHREYVDPLMYETGIVPVWTDSYQVHIAPYEVPTYPGAVYYTEEQNKVIELYKTSLDEFAIEMTAKFIAGEMELNEETWAEFQKQLEGYNATDYDAVLKEAYASYMAAA